jgi:hypothetical protein
MPGPLQQWRVFQNSTTRLSVCSIPEGDGLGFESPQLKGFNVKGRCSLVVNTGLVFDRTERVFLKLLLNSARAG